jgi:uncharacterized protein YqjF (DUF2071 family)
VRTYVHHEGEAGIFFLVEFLPNLINRIAGLKTFGLPLRWGELRYEHDADPRGGAFFGEVVPVFGQGRLTYRGMRPEHGEDHEAEPGSREEFLFERYNAFTRERAVSRRFRVWHRPWRFAELDLHVNDDSLLEGTGEWYRHAEFAGAAHSRGLVDVWMGRPVCVNGPACAYDASAKLKGCAASAAQFEEDPHPDPLPKGEGTRRNQT